MPAQRNVTIGTFGIPLMLLFLVSTISSSLTLLSQIKPRIFGFPSCLWARCKSSVISFSICSNVRSGRLVAFESHDPMQIPQLAHLLTIISACRRYGLPSFLGAILMASYGQSLLHCSHPTHFSNIIWAGGSLLDLPIHGAIKTIKTPPTDVNQKTHLGRTEARG